MHADYRPLTRFGATSQWYVESTPIIKTNAAHQSGDGELADANQLQ
jgi:hypothetical protein